MIYFGKNDYPERRLRMLKSKIKPVFKCSEEFKLKFKDSRCLVTISVGQEVHEGKKFLTTIDLIKRKNAQHYAYGSN